MTSVCRIYLSESHDPWFNLAMEDWLLHDMQSVDQALFLWRNDNTVVIGRSQNPWLECHLEKMKSNGIRLARRQSGGGAVFHDLGNTNFTFLSKKDQYDKKRNLKMILDALSQFGIEANAHGRNDLVVEVEPGQLRKISGSAFKEKLDRAFHHGTLLLNADLSALARYLQPNKKKLEAKGIQSVRSRVVNCTELHPTIEHHVVCEKIIQFFRQNYCCDVEPTIISDEDMAQYTGLQARYDHLSSEAWLLGQTMPFTHQIEERFDWGGIDIRLHVKQARIASAQVFSDCLLPDLIADLALSLRDQPYDCLAIEQVLNLIAKKHHQAMANDIKALMLAEIR